MKNLIFNLTIALFFLVAGGITLTPNDVKAQTNPVPQSLPFSENFADLDHSSTTWPAGIQGWRINNVGPGSDFFVVPAQQNRGLTANATAADTGNDVYNFDQKIGFRSTTGGNNFIALALNTTGYENITFTYDIMTIRNLAGDDPNNWVKEVGLQYRIGTSGNFTNIPGTLYQNPDDQVQTSGTDGQAIQNISITLPSAVDNEPIVQLRWVKREISGASGNNARPSFAIKNLSASGDELKFSNFYYTGSGNLTNVNNWGSNTDGSGSNPSSFNLDDVVFVIANTASVSLGEDWTVSGENSRIEVGDGSSATTLHLQAHLTASVDVKNQATLRLSNSNYPTLGTLEAGSTVIFSDDATTIPYRSYSNLVFDDINPQFTHNGTITVTGNLTLAGAVNFPEARDEDEFSFTFSGTATQTISGNGNVLRSYNMDFNKSEGSVTLDAANGGTTLSTDNQITFITGSGASFADNGQTIYAGNSVNIAGDGDSYTFTGTLILAGTEAGIVNGAGAGNNFNIREGSNNNIVAKLNNIILRVANTGGEFRFRDGSTDVFTIKGNFIVEAGADGRIRFYDNEVVVGGNFIIEDGFSGSIDGIEKLTFNGSGAQTLDSALALETEDLEVDKPSGTFTVDAGSNLSVSNLLTIENGTMVNNGTVIIESDAYYLNNAGTVEPSLTFERLLSNHSRWVGMASPVSGSIAGEGGLLDALWTQGFPGSDDPSANNANVLFFNESDTDAANNTARYQASVSNSFAAGTGMIVYVYKNKDRDDDDTAIDFNKPFPITGQQNTFTAGEFDFGVTYTAAGAEGWNLLGNPFAAPLDWADASWTKTNMNSFAYVWNPDQSRFDATTDDSDEDTGTLSSTRIAPFQAFFTKANSDDASLIAKPDALNSESTTHLNHTTTKPLVKLDLEMGDFNAEAVVRFGEDYESGLDNFDAYFLTPLGATWSYLFTYTEENALMINSLPVDLDEVLTLPLYLGAFDSGEIYNGSATLSFPVVRDLPENWEIQLVDLETGVTIDVISENSYDFDLGLHKANQLISIESARNSSSPVMSTNKAMHRFELIINPSVATNTPIENELPKSIALSQNYPNPFNPTTQIRFDLPESSEVRLDVFNIQGQRVATLVNESRSAGTHSVTFDASTLSSGVYLYRLQAANTILTRKMTLIK